jgi:short subunit dehydrogenase-like uncharacterized protein
MRDLDVILYGASGFVGRLTAEYLAKHAPDGLRVGLGGRSSTKLEALRSSLGVDWPIVIADSDDAAALAAMTARTRVVVSTVGPYQRYGIKLVEACARAGTHYADLTGEVLFVHRTASQFHELAQETGARIVHSCGFDSIPSDLGVLELHQAVERDGAGELGETVLQVVSMRGGFSGGTIDSMRAQVEEITADKSLRRIIADPYALSPARTEEPAPRSERDSFRVRRDPLTGDWTGPFVMASYNTRIVRRSNALRNWAYGRGFRYREEVGFGRSLAAPVLAGAMTAGLGAVAGGMMFGPTRAVLDKVLPAPGEGPSEATRRRGRFVMALTTRTTSGARYTAKVAAKGDPGYAATSVMLGESALCLALDESLPEAAGVLTPATAMGPALADRLRAAGFVIEARRAS